jgi:hypothetical protein
VIIAVFVVVTLVLLVMTGLVFMAQAETAARLRTTQRTQSRSLGWSAAQVLMDQLNAQRFVILDGRTPELLQHYELFRHDNRLGVVRLLAVDDRGALLQPQAALLDLNEIDAEMLAATNVVDSALAQQIIDHRDGASAGRFDSLADVCAVPGIEPRLVFGPPGRFDVMNQAQQPRESRSEGAPSRSDDAPPQALSDVATVFGFEPAIQRNEKQRINLNVPWSDELGRRVDERFGEGTSSVLKRLFDEIDFDEEARLVQVLIRFDVDLEDWAEILDVLTTEPGQLHFGRVDINTASREVLAALPGIEPEQAAQIVQMRDSLDAEERATMLWPALHDILPREAYVELAGRLTTRSWTYRVRFATGLVDTDEPDGPIEDPVIYELVIDLCAPQPRIAYMRDITMLQSAVMIAFDATNRGIGLEPIDDDSAADVAADAVDAAGDDGEGDEPPPARGTSSSDAPASPAEASAEPGAQPEPQPVRRRPGRWTTGE